MKTNQIICGDNRKIIPSIPNEFIDLIITSPPYNLNHDYDEYDDNRTHEEFLEFMREVFNLVYPKLRKGGRMVVNIGDGRNGSISSSSDLIQLFKDLGYSAMTHIIWDKAQVNSRTAWGSFKSCSAPSFPTPFEHLLVFCKDTSKLQCGGETDLTKKEFIDWSLALWRFPPETNQRQYRHKAVFPLELPKRCLKMLSWKDSVVLDPFIGSGTTALACAMLGRQYLGIDISEKYCETARKRIKDWGRKYIF